LGAVTNGDGSFRPTNDLSFPHGNPSIPSVNSFVDKLNHKMTWDNFNIVSSFIQGHPNCIQLALFDWAKAYRQIPTAANEWPYLMIKNFEGNLVLDTRITFGGVAGCGSFGQPSEAWKKIMCNRFDLIKIFCWVNNNLLIKSMESETSMDEIVAKSSCQPL
jgi:hypothetical protein